MKIIQNNIKPFESDELPSHLRIKRVWKIDWIGNDHKVKSGAQDFVLSQLKENEHLILSYTNKHSRLWGALTYLQLKELIDKDHGLYEVLVADRKRKVYFDVDKTDRKLDEIKMLILDAFPDARMQVSGREGSWHIILSNYYANNLAAMMPVKFFAILHKELGFDTGVYHQNRNMKCINQCKPKRVNEHQLHVDGSMDASKHLIMHDFDHDAIDIASMKFDFMEAVITAEKSTDKKTAKNTLRLDLMTIPQLELPVPEDFELSAATPLQKLALIPCYPRGHESALHHDTMWRLLVWAKKNGISFEQFYAWAKGRDSTIPFLKKYSDTWDRADRYQVSPKLVESVLVRFFPTILEGNSIAKFRHQFDLKEEEMVDGVDGGYYSWSQISVCRRRNSIPTALERHILPLHQPKKYSVLTGPMGGGKTEAVIDYLRHHCKGMRILWLACRITLSENTLARLKDAGMEAKNYREFTDAEKKSRQMDEERFLICSIQSLHYLNKEFDVVIIDEIETLLNTFYRNAETHRRNLAKNWHIFVRFLESACKVICMDAFTTRLTTNLVKGLIRNSNISDHMEVLKTDKKPAERTFMEVEKEKHFWTCLHEALTSGKKLYIFTPFKTGATGVVSIAGKLEETFGWREGRDFLCYFQEQEVEKRRLSEVDAVWCDPNIRVILTNNTISVGVNFNRPDIFDQIFCIYTPMIPVRDFIQSLYRIRHPRIKDMILYRFKCLGVGTIKDERIRHPDCDLYQKMREDLDIEAAANRECADWGAFNIFCERTNITTVPLDLPAAVNRNRDAVKKFLASYDAVFAWDGIKDIDERTCKDYVVLIQSNCATMNHRLEVEKFFFKKNFVMDTPSLLLVNVWNFGTKLVKKVERLVASHWIDPEDDWIYEPKTHIINRILLENNVDLAAMARKGRIEGDNLPMDEMAEMILEDGEGFPELMTTSISKQEILNSFYFDKRVGESTTGIVAMCINAYFERRVYNWKQKKINGRKVYVYKTNPNFWLCFQTCLRYRDTSRDIQDPLDMFADSDEEEESVEMEMDLCYL